MLPYASYLRVYEPPEALAGPTQLWLETGDAAADSHLTLAAEQHTVLTRAVISSGHVIDANHAPGAYVLHRGGKPFLCPVDMPLRSWLSLTSLVESVGDATATLLFPAHSLAIADDAFLSWRRDHPRAVPHIRQATWGVPRTWFVLVVEDERQSYVARGLTSVRFRASIIDARRRVAAAHKVLLKVIDETEVLDDLADLGRWLDAFDDASWVELDYAGVARLLGRWLDSDQSARDVHTALKALRKGDFATAGASYRVLEERWRVVSAYERAN